jgi:transaldolase
MHYPRIFLDTADIEKLKDAVRTGIVDGIATNPNKIAESQKSYRQVIDEIRTFFDGPIAVQGMGRTKEQIVQHALKLHHMDPNLAIKVTCNIEGIKAIRELVEQGVQTNCTLIYSASQGLAAGRAGSPFISPFVGRSEMAGYNGVEVIGKIRAIYEAFGIETCIIAASIKNVHQVVESVIAGAHAVAVTWPVFESMINHPMTQYGYGGFEETFTRIPQD